MIVSYLYEIHEILVLQGKSWHQSSVDNYAAMAWNREGKGKVVHESYIIISYLAQPLPFVLQKKCRGFSTQDERRPF